MKHKDYEKYYCGKTIDIDRRIKEHRKDRWCNYNLFCVMNGDLEKPIKKFGVKQFLLCMQSIVYAGG